MSIYSPPSVSNTLYPAYNYRPQTQPRPAFNYAGQAAASNPMSSYRNAMPLQGAGWNGYSSPTYPTSYNPMAALALQAAGMNTPMASYAQANSLMAPFSDTSAMSLPTAQPTESPEQAKSSSNNPMDKSFWTSWKGFSVGGIALALAGYGLYRLLYPAESTNAPKTHIETLAEAVKAKDKAKADETATALLKKVKELAQAAKQYKTDDIELSEADKKALTKENLDQYETLAKEFSDLAKANVEAGNIDVIKEKQTALIKAQEAIDQAITNFLPKRLDKTLEKRTEFRGAFPAIKKDDATPITKKAALEKLDLKKLEELKSAYISGLEQLTPQENDGHKPIIALKEAFDDYKKMLDGKKDKANIDMDKLKALKDSLKTIDTKLFKENAELQKLLKINTKNRLTKLQATIKSLQETNLDQAKREKLAADYNGQVAALNDGIWALNGYSCCEKGPQIDDKFSAAPKDSKDIKALEEHLTKVENHLK